MAALSKVAIFAALAGSVCAQLSGEVVAQLRNAGTATERLALLKDEDLIFNFLAPPSGIVMGAAGHTVEASSANFPAVIGNGVAMTIGFLGPCGINTPHTHPRATEINFSVNGTLRTGLLTENGARFVVSDLPAGSASVFPMGAIHFEMNTGCEPATFVAAFNHEDPGVTSLGQRYFGLPADIVGATLGGLGVEEVVGLESKIPDNIAIGTEECLQRCGLARPSSQPTVQHQPKVSGNSPPGTNTSPTTSTSTSTSSSTSTSTPATSSTPHAAAAVVPTTSPTSSTTSHSTSAAASSSPPANKNISGSSQLSATEGSSNSGNNNTSLLIALVVVNGVLVVGLLAAVFMYLQNRSRRSLLDPHKYGPPATPPDPLLKAEKYELGRDSTYYDPYTPTLPEAGRSS